MAKNLVSIDLDNTEYSLRPYGTCSTAAGTAAKTVNISEFTLCTGATILVKFSNSNNIVNPTLNVNGTGAKPITHLGHRFDSNIYYEFIYNGSAWVQIGEEKHRCSVASGNKNNYPWHRIAYTDVLTTAYIRRTISLILNQAVFGGKYGELVIKVNTNSANTNSSYEVYWVVNKGFGADDIKIGVNNTYGNTYFDVFYKCPGTWQNLLIEQKTGGYDSSFTKSFTLCSSQEVSDTTTTDKLTSYECYTTIESAATELHNTAYTAIISPNTSSGTLGKISFNGDLTGNAATATTSGDSNKLGGQLPSYYATAADYVKKSGDTMTGDLTIKRNSSDSPSIILQRGETNDTFEDWRMSNVGGYFKIQNRNSGNTWVDVLSLAPSNTKTLTSSYSVLPSTNNALDLGSSSMKWQNVYATTFHGSLSGNASSATLASTVSVGVGSSDAYRPIVVHNGSALYSAGDTTGKPRYNYATGDIKAKSFTTDGGIFTGNLTGNADTASNASKLNDWTRTDIQVNTNSNAHILFDTTPMIINGVNLHDTKCKLVTAPDNNAPFKKVWLCTEYTSWYSPSDKFIYVTPGDTICVESWIMRKSDATGTAGVYYLGLQFKDKNGNNVNDNAGTIYMSSASNWTCPTDGVWYRRFNEYTIPKSHTAYNGSDGGSYYTAQIRLLINHGGGTIPTYFGGFRIYKRIMAKTDETGGVKVAGTRTTAITTTQGGTTSSRYYGVEIDSTGKAFVNVPWTDTNTDTKNTTGATNSTSKMYLIGATSQGDNPQTYSNSNVYVTNGDLVANSFQGSIKGTSANNVNTAYKDLHFQFYNNVTGCDSTVSTDGKRYAGTANSYGFPVSNNANAMLWIGAHSGNYGHQLGFSSDGRIYDRCISNGSFPTTVNGGSWKKIAYTSDIITPEIATETEIKNADWW